MQYDYENNGLYRGAIQYNFNDKINIGTSFNKKNIYRTSSEYYNYSKKKYVEKDSLFFLGNVGINERYPDVNNALDNYGANFFIDFQPKEKINFNLSLGTQQSESQRIYVDNQATPFSNNTSTSHYVNLNSKIQGFTSQVSYLKGRQNTTGVLGWEYDYKTIDAVFEYEIKWKNLKIRPGLSYRQAVYNDEKAVAEYGKDRAFLGEEKKLQTKSGMLRAEYNLKKLRLISAVRIDKYNNPDNYYFPYQFIASYKISKKNLLRFNISRANRGAFLLDTYYNQNFQFGPIKVEMRGNDDLKLLVMDMVEIGFRSVVTKKTTIDLELFSQKTKNYASLEAVKNNNSSLFEFQFLNVNVTAQQYGGTINLNYILNKKLNFKAFLTIQRTYLENYPVIIAKSTQDTVENIKLNSTPTYSGGLIMNYQLSKKINININSYLLSKQQLNTTTRVEENDNYYTLPTIVVLNAKVSYKLTKWGMIYVNARNLLNQNREEVIWADRLSPSVFLGVNLNF